MLQQYVCRDIGHAGSLGGSLEQLSSLLSDLQTSQVLNISTYDILLHQTYLVILSSVVRKW